nr:cobalamin biosynthesis protein [Rhodococcus sp. (in: high G+C Gram-positive bacteria)]
MPEHVIVGLGARAAATVDQCLQLIAELVRPTWIVEAVATIESKSALAEAVAQDLGVRCVVFSAAELGAVEVPTPSMRVREAVGVPSVAEASAITGSGGGQLVVAKASRGGVSVAVAQCAGIDVGANVQ